MAALKKDEAREYRITMEAVVDAYGPEERAMGWYYNLKTRSSSRLKRSALLRGEYPH